MANYQRGSEWRRWDLHIHTPGTMKNDQFNGQSIDEKWGIFYSDIENYIGDGKDNLKSIAAIGITDYISLDNYKKIISDNKIPKSVELVIPNVEMRIQPIAQDSPINIHFLFDPEIVDELDSRFFSKIRFPYSSTDYNAMRDSLIRLGRVHSPDLEENLAYKKGIEQFVPSFDAIAKVFKDDADLRKHVIIGVSNASNDGVSGAVNHCSYLESEDSQLKTFRQAIYNFVDFIFSATPSDIAYFSGKKATCPPEKIRKECGSLMACVHGCDAHGNDKIFEPDEKRYCWIKADPTFEGLKQIIYEPVERVMISEIKPETKSDYYVIDRVEFSDPSFSNAPIYFNDKLTCIIGGKSTGKSILIQNMAKAIDRKEAEKSLDKSKNKTLDVSNLKVFWVDGCEKDRKIIYIPQTYLNKLSDEQEEKTEIDKWIQDILFANNDILDAVNDFQDNVKKLKIETDKTIVDLISTYQEYTKIRNEQKEIGDEVGIKAELKKLQDEKDKITKELKISEQDIKSYDDTVKKIDDINRDKNKLSEDKKLIESLQSLIIADDIDENIQAERINEIKSIQDIIVGEANKKWEEEKNKIILSINDKSSSLDKEIGANTETVSRFKPLIESSKAVQELSAKIQLENVKLVKYNNCQDGLKKLLDKINTVTAQLVSTPEIYKKYHLELVDCINTHQIKGQDLSFYSEVQFRKEAFIDKLVNIYNNRSSEFKNLIDVDKFTEDDYSKEKISEISEKTIEGSLMLKVGFTVESALRDIFADWYNTMYRVKMGEDTINVMSPGKKALVLLKILISLADSKCPILIDQPEDDLDNRSIYDDLIEFIKDKKKERQIIVVTHNANIVLGADAEEIIVANQKGHNSPNKEFKFEYRSGSIENNSYGYKEGGGVEEGILNSQGIQQHICDILEGGKTAFALRKNKYRIDNIS